MIVQLHIFLNYLNFFPPPQLRYSAQSVFLMCFSQSEVIIFQCSLSGLIAESSCVPESLPSSSLTLHIFVSYIIINILGSILPRVLRQRLLQALYILATGMWSSRCQSTSLTGAVCDLFVFLSKGDFNVSQVFWGHVSILTNIPPEQRFK